MHQETDTLIYNMRLYTPTCTSEDSYTTGDIEDRPTYNRRHADQHATGDTPIYNRIYYIHLHVQPKTHNRRHRRQTYIQQETDQNAAGDRHQYTTVDYTPTCTTEDTNTAYNCRQRNTYIQQETYILTYNGRHNRCTYNRRHTYIQQMTHSPGDRQTNIQQDIHSNRHTYIQQETYTNIQQ